MINAKDIENKIYKLYEKITQVCKDFKEKYHKQHIKHILQISKLQIKQNKTKDYKMLTKNIMIVIDKYKNSDVYKQYMAEFDKYIDYSKINKSLQRKYDKEQKDKNKQIKELEDRYHKTKSYMNHMKEIKKMEMLFLKKNSYVKDLKLCSFQNSKNEYIEIIQLFIQYLEENNKTNAIQYNI